MHIAEVVTIAKSLPLLRLNTYKSLILSYSADYRRILDKKHFLENLFKSSDICANVCSRKTWEFLNILLIVKEFMDIFAIGID